MDVHADAPDRLATYRRLQSRNRLVGILRIGVPALGAVTLAVMMGQIYLASLGSRFGVGRIDVTRENINVEAPEYSGLLDDGSAYRVWATKAAAALNTTDLIDLTDAALTIDRPTGVSMQANAIAARLDTTRQLVIINNDVHVEDSTGTVGVFYDSVFDWARQTLTADGSVTIDYADGTALEAQGMVYDSQASVWTFSNVTVTLPDTPSTAKKAESP